MSTPIRKGFVPLLLLWACLTGALVAACESTDNEALIEGPATAGSGYAIDFNYSTREMFGFNIEQYLREKAVHLLPYAEQISHVAGEQRISPRALIALMELRSGAVKSPAFDAERPLGDLSNKNGFVEQIRDVSTRLRSMAQTDEMRVVIDSPHDAILAILPAAELSKLSHTYQQLFPGIVSHPVRFEKATSQIPLQFPYPVGESWMFGGTHSFSGGGSPMSSIDFQKTGRSWGSSYSEKVVAAAGGKVKKHSSCYLTIIHSNNWSTSYYHLMNIMVADGATVTANQPIAQYANTKAQALCDGGSSTGPHLHWSLYYANNETSLSGKVLSGYTVHPGSFGYDDNCSRMYYTKDGKKVCPWTSVRNDALGLNPDDDVSDDDVTPPDSSTSFSIVVIPDSQIMVESSPTMFSNQVKWIKNQASALNIKFVSHVGDLVNNNSSSSQWQSASNAMYQLDNVLPYAIAPGNHDTGSGEYSTFNKYFPHSKFSGKSWYGGAFNNRNDNSYQLFSTNGMDFIIIHLAYAPDSAERSWASGLLSQYASRRAIISTHSFQGSSGMTAEGNAIWSDVVKNHDNVFMVVCGHIHDQRYVVYKNSFGHDVHVLLSDYQGDSPQGGKLRYYTFRPGENAVYAYTYSTQNNKYYTDGASQFKFVYKMSSSTDDGEPGTDQCPNDPNKIKPGQCGCGTPDTDSDGDGSANCKDSCPNDPKKVVPGQCGCGIVEGTCSGTCADKAGFIDAQGYRCDEWVGYDCTSAAEVYGYTEAEESSILSNCKKTCNQCSGMTDQCPNDPNKTEPGLCGCGVPEGTCSGGKVTHIGTTKVYDSNGQGLTISRPSGTQAGDLLILALHRTDDDLPLRVSGWTRVAECYKTDNDYQCATEDDCTSWHNSDFCGYFGSSGGEGHDLAQGIFYRAVSSSEPSSYSFNLNRDSSGHPGWAILTALRGAATSNPVRDWDNVGCDGNVHSAFPSVYGQSGDMLLLSQAYDDAIGQSAFGAPAGTALFGYTTGSDETGFLYGGLLTSSGNTGTKVTTGAGSYDCKDALISLTIKPK